MTRVPRWVRVAAWGAPAVVLPSSLWRLTAVVNPNPACDIGRAWEPYYVVGLSVVSLTAALLTLGLVYPWGEIAPAWLPGIGGRRLPCLAVTAAAAAGVLLTGSVVVFGALNPIFEWHWPTSLPPPGCVSPTETEGAWLVYAAYLPLALWPVLLAVVTVRYYRRRRHGMRAELVG